MVILPEVLIGILFGDSLGFFFFSSFAGNFLKISAGETNKSSSRSSTWNFTEIFFRSFIRSLSRSLTANSLKTSNDFFFRFFFGLFFQDFQDTRKDFLGVPLEITFRSLLGFLLRASLRILSKVTSEISL